MADITIADVTDGIVAGTGAFDVFMQAVKAHITDEYNAGRITGKEYATVYLGGLQAALSQAVQFVLQEQEAGNVADKTAAEIALLEQKTATEEAQTKDATTLGTGGGINPVVGVVGKQKGLLQKQTDGFDRDAEQKILKILMDSFAVRRSTNSGEFPPDKADNEDISQVILAACTAIGVTLDDTYTVGGTVSGLTATGLILQNDVNSGGPGDNLPVLADGQWTFDTILDQSDTWAVSILQQPAGQVCVISRDAEDFGEHTATTHATVLTDSTKSWTPNAFIGMKLLNLTDGSSGTITANTATTITVTALTGGTDNDWDTGDSYAVGAGASGTIAGADVTNVTISCV